jgi:hypothetical protein
MADNTEGYTAYDIECLTHVYNKFVLGPSDVPVTDIDRIFTYNGLSVRLDLSRYRNIHPNILSVEFAILIGESINSIISIEDIMPKLKAYCNTYCIIGDLPNRECLIPNEPLIQLITKDNYKMYRTKDGYISKDNYKMYRTKDGYISYCHIIHCLIVNGHIKMYLQDDPYVLK